MFSKEIDKMLNRKKLLIFYSVSCSETRLTGESRYHISTPRGFEPGSFVMGSKQVVHWTSETRWEWSEIAGSSQGFPPAADSVGCEAGRDPAASVKLGQESCARSSGIITLSAQGPSDGSGQGPPQSRPQWSITTWVTNVERGDGSHDNTSLFLYIRQLL